MKRSKGDTFGVQSFTLACGRGISAFTLPRDRSRVTESVRYPSPLSLSTAYSVPLACPRGIPGDALSRNRLRATESGHFSSPLGCLVACPVALEPFHGIFRLLCVLSRHPPVCTLARPRGARPSARSHTHRMMQNQQEEPSTRLRTRYNTHMCPLSSAG